MARVIKKIPLHCVYQWVDSPVGQLLVIVDDTHLYGILWKSDLENTVTAEHIAKMKEVKSHRLLNEVKRQLAEYFKKERVEFDLPICLNGTDFQNSAWQELTHIPYGETVSYETQALKLGSKKKVRAVGAANGANPISIVVPCHRVVGKNGGLTGFAGGVDTKARLLSLESDQGGFEF